MENERILIVEDDPDIAHVLEVSLRQAGYRVSVASDGGEALQMIRQSSPDLVILDLMMQPIDGWEVLYWLQASQVDIPIIVLTAHTSFHEESLDKGSADFLVKPTRPSIVLAHVRARLREKKLSPHSEELQILRFADIQIHVQAHLAYRGERELDLTPTEYELLLLFVRYPGQVLTHGFILDRVWGENSDSLSNTVAVYVRYLRQKLEAEGESRLIETVRGIGYVLRTKQMNKGTSAETEEPTL